MYRTATRHSEFHHMQPPWRLTKLYSDAKQSYRHVCPIVASDDAPEISSLHRKSRIQKDRLIAWGFDWQDNGCAEGSIDESVERAGLTEVVSSVLENIKNILDDLESTQARARPNLSAFPLEKASPEISTVLQWTSKDKAHYADLIKDLTSAIDLLCELSRSRKSAVLYPTEKRAFPSSEDVQPKYFGPTAADSKDALRFDSSEKRITSEGAQAFALKDLEVNASSLLMPEEAPPPYDNFGMPYPTREVGRLRRGSKGVVTAELFVPILLEYAQFDSIYQETNVPLPMDRLEEICGIMAPPTSSRPSSLLRLLGYFQDAKRPRVGLIYELPAVARARSPGEAFPASTMRPTSLFNLLQSAAKSQPNQSNISNASVPPLEERFGMAQELVSGFLYLFDRGFTHRDVNSSNITLFPKQTSRQLGQVGPPYAFRKPVISSFDLFTEYDIDASPENLSQNIYRHPDNPRIKAPSASNEHHARFEVYSLSLILLEIGLWIPLAEMFKEKYSLKDFRLRLEKIRIPRLAAKCGSAYMHAVQECFQAGNDANITDQALRDVYERVLGKLHRCCLLDDGEEGLYVTQSHEFSLEHKDSISAESIRDMKEDDGGPLDEGGKQLDRSTTSNQNPRKSHLSASSEDYAPSGAWPQKPLEPEFELSQFIELYGHEEENSKPKRYSFTDCKLPRDVLEQWPALGRRLTKIVSKALRNSPESSSIGIELTGETESTARPTLSVMCTSTKRVSKAIQKYFEFDTNVFDLIVIRGKICRSKSSPARSGGPRRSARRRPSDEQAKNKAHHTRPLCGASIGAWRDYEHLPPVSLGGIILVDGEPYGMSVHHMLEDPDQDDDGSNQSPVRSSHPSAQVGLDNAGVVSTEYAGSEASFSLSGSEDEGFVELEGDSGLEDEWEYGDTEGIAKGDGGNIKVTQPALADVVPDFFPNEEDKDDEHLISHEFGHVHASSGIKRRTHKGVEHEIDWALIKLDKDRLQPHNVIAGGRRHCSEGVSKIAPKLLDPVCREEYPVEEDLYPDTIAKSEELSGLPIHCFGRTSGLGSGRISKAMRFVKMHGRRSWAESWTVEGNLGVPGDSGAWLADNEQGRICGHVLAWSTQWDMAYISPMDVTFEDMKACLGAESVCLPGSQSEVSGPEDSASSESTM